MRAPAEHLSLASFLVCGVVCGCITVVVLLHGQAPSVELLARWCAGKSVYFAVPSQEPLVVEDLTMRAMRVFARVVAGLPRAKIVSLEAEWNARLMSYSEQATAGKTAVADVVCTVVFVAALLSHRVTRYDI